MEAEEWKHAREHTRGSSRVETQEQEEWDRGKSYNLHTDGGEQIIGIVKNHQNIVKIMNILLLHDIINIQ